MSGRELLPALALGLLGVAVWLAPKDAGIATVVALVAAALVWEWKRGLAPRRKRRRG